METWEIAKKLLLDDGFRVFYSSYQKGVKLSRSLKNYGRVNMSSVKKDDLHNMLKKINRCEELVRYGIIHYNLPFQSDSLRYYKSMIREQLGMMGQSEKVSKLSRQEKRRIDAMTNHGKSKSKNK